MGLVLILDACRNMRTLPTILALLVIVSACSSPLDLDVDRTLTFDDGLVQPKRMSLLYYYGDSAYEALYVDTTFLSTVLIDTTIRPYRVTIPQMNTPIFPCSATADHSPLIRGFGFSVSRHPCNEQLTAIANPYTYVNVELLDNNGRRSNQDWTIGTRGTQFYVGLLASPENRLIKGRLTIRVPDPDRPRTLTYHGVLTIEY